jgi:hypothetical protein
MVSVEAAVAALDSNVWDLVVAEERPRAVADSGVDAGDPRAPDLSHTATQQHGSTCPRVRLRQ